MPALSAPTNTKIPPLTRRQDDRAFRRALFQWLSLLPLFLSLSVSRAADVSDLEFKLSGGSYSVSKCMTDADGSIEIPAMIDGIAVNKIGPSAFEGCKDLTSVVLPHTVQFLGTRAFAGCAGILSIQFSSNLVFLGDEAFRECVGLQQIVLPDSLRHLGDQAFLLCTNLNDVELGEGLAEIGEAAFGGCQNLETVKLPPGLRSIGGRAFAQCSLLKNLPLPSGLEVIGERAFFMSGLVSLAMPASVRDVGDQCFFLCEGLTSVDVGGSVTILGNRVFTSCPKLVSVNLPEGLEQIGSECLRDCPALRNLALPGSLRSIGWRAVEGFSGIETVEINGFRLGFLSSGTSSFLVKVEGGSGELIIPETYNGKPILSVNAFTDHSGLASVRIPASVEIIGEYAFRNCPVLQSVAMQSGLKIIGDYAFSACTALETIKIVPSLTSVGEGAFYGCSSLASVSFPVRSPVEYIGRNAFSGTKVPAYIDPASSLGFILTDSSAFLVDGSQARGEVTIPESVSGRQVRSVNGFSNNYSITSVTIPQSVRTIGPSAFSNCFYLTKVAFAEGLLEIEHDAFNGCQFSELQLPGSLVAIGEYAFGGSTKLRKVSFGTELSKVGSYAFYGCRTIERMWFPGNAPEMGTLVVRPLEGSYSVVVQPEHAASFGGNGAYWHGRRVIVDNLDHGNFHDALRVWSRRESGTSTAFGSIATGNGALVATAVYMGSVFVSNDALNWSPVALGSGVVLKKVIYGGGLFVAVGSIYFGPTLGYKGVICTSENGWTWRLSVSGSPLRAIAYGSGNYVACGDGGGVWRSTNGLAWDQVDVGVVGNMEAVAFGNGHFLMTCRGGTPVFLSSSDGFQWSDVPQQPSAGMREGIGKLEFEGYRFLGEGSSGGIWHSPDALGDFRITSSNSATVNGFAYGGGVFLAATDSAVEVSLDGEEWIPYPLPAIFNDVAYFGNTFVAVGVNGGIWQSNPVVGESGFAGWRQAFFPGAPAGSGAEQDFDGDRNSNIFEYATGSNPREIVECDKPEPLFDGSRLSIRLPRNPSAGGVRVIAERSSDMREWTKLGIEVSNGPADEWLISVAVTLPIPKAQFLRVGFEEEP